MIYLLMKSRFRWVVCQLDMLRNCVTPHALRKALGSLPKTLDETYERILSNIDESYTTDVQRVISYLAFCQWPPTLNEMVEILAIDWDAEEPQFEAQNRIPDPKDILTMCSSLVTVSDGRVKVSSLGGTAYTTTLRLAHFSVKEYLTSTRIKSSKASNFAVAPDDSNLFITRTYITYLLQPAFSSGYEGWAAILERCKDFPLTNAAAQLWPTQLRLVGDHIDGETRNLILKFFNTRHMPGGGQYGAWVGTLIPDSPLATILNTHPLYYCASYGLTPLVRILLQNTPPEDIDIHGGRARSTPLHVAVFRGKTDCVQLLLDAGANPNSTNTRRESCLFWARGKGRKEIYDLLVKYGAVEGRGAFDTAGGLTLKEVMGAMRELREIKENQENGAKFGSDQKETVDRRTENGLPAADEGEDGMLSGQGYLRAGIQELQREQKMERDLVTLVEEKDKGRSVGGAEDGRLVEEMLTELQKEEENMRKKEFSGPLRDDQEAIAKRQRAIARHVKLAERPIDGQDWKKSELKLDKDTKQKREELDTLIGEFGSGPGWK
jgi:hypothetical protein